MEDFQKRVVEEKAELDSKLHKLRTFIASDKFRQLTNPDHAWLLVMQMRAMENYTMILDRRLTLWGIE